MSNSEIIIILTAVGIGCFAVLLAIRLMRFARETRQLRTQLAEQGASDSEAFEQGQLRQQIAEMASLVEKFRTDAQNWALLFKFKPHVQGKWGEIQVENLLQFAGMKKGQDYDTQVKQGKFVADFMLYLPDGRQFIVDSKVTVESVADYHNAETSADRKRHLRVIANRVRTHARNLAAKFVPPNDGDGADFVVMCIPDYPLQLALEHDNSLIEEFANKNVIITGQSALLALVKSVAMGWRSVRLSENAENILEVGKGMYSHLLAFKENLDDVHKSLQRAMRSSHLAQSQFDVELLSQARRFEDMGM